MDSNPTEWLAECHFPKEVCLYNPCLKTTELSVGPRILRTVRKSGASERSRRSRPKACTKEIRLSVVFFVVVKDYLILSLVVLFKVRRVTGTVLVRSSVVLVL